MLSEALKITNFGLYDSTLVHPTVTATPEGISSAFEFEFILEDGKAAYINDIPCDIKKNSVICIKPGMRRYTLLPYKCLYFHLTSNDVEILEKLSFLPDVINPQDSSNYFRLFTKIIMSQDRGDSEFLQLKYLFELLSLLETAKNSTCKSDQKSSMDKNVKLIEPALCYIDENLSSPLSLEEVASVVHLSRIYFHKLFLSTMGVTLHRYVLKKRLDLAKKLLLTSDMPCGDIAVECGFSSQSYFNSAFRREFGISPKEYIKQMSAAWSER